MEFEHDVPSPTAPSSPNHLEEALRRPSPVVTISNVLVILPSMTRGFQPKNYHPPAYQNIGRSPSLPVNDIFSLPRNQSPVSKLSRSRMSIAYGHAASQQYSSDRLQAEGSELDTNSQSDSPQDVPGSATPPYAMSSGHLSPAARKEITAQLSVPITPNSLPSDARRQSISTLLPAGVMSAKLSQLVLEEEEANQRDLDAIMERESSTTPEVIVDPVNSLIGRDTSPENAPEEGRISTSLKPRPLGLSRSTSNSESSTPKFGQSVTARPGKRVRSRPQTSAAALSSTADSPPTFGASSTKPALISPGTHPVPSPLEMKPDQKRSRAVGTGKPGWEGDEVVNILREDGIQGKQTCRPRTECG